MKKICQNSFPYNSPKLLANLIDLIVDSGADITLVDALVAQELQEEKVIFTHREE
jgi:hypothetical protein